MALANSGLLEIEEETIVPNDPNLKSAANVLSEIDAVRMQTGANFPNLLPSEMTAMGGDLAAANAAQAAMPPPPTPIRRDFDPNAYLQAMAGGSQQMKRETGIMGALGYALKLQNPSFDASSYINNYKQKKYAQMKQQYEAMSVLDQKQVERQAVRRMLEADPKNVKEFNTWFQGLGVPNLGLLNNTFDMWRKMHPAIDPDKDFLPGGRLSTKGIYSRHKDYRTQIKPLVQAADKFRTKANKVMTGLTKGTGLGDITAIKSFEKMIDEGVVREGDVALLGSAASVFDQIALKVNNLKKGEKLPPRVRKQMADIARDFFLKGTELVDIELRGWKDTVDANPQLDWYKVIPRVKWDVLQNPDYVKIPESLKMDTGTRGGSRETPLTNHPYTTETELQAIPNNHQFMGKYVELPNGDVFEVTPDEDDQ